MRQAGTPRKESVSDFFAIHVHIDIPLAACRVGHWEDHKAEGNLGLYCLKPRHSFAVICERNEGPFGRDFCKTTQTEPSEAHDTFDNSKDRLHGLFSSSVKISGFCSFQPVLHGKPPGFGYPAWLPFCGPGSEVVRSAGTGPSNGDRRINALFPQFPDRLPAGVTGIGENGFWETDRVFHRQHRVGKG